MLTLMSFLKGFRKHKVAGLPRRSDVNLSFHSPTQNINIVDTVSISCWERDIVCKDARREDAFGERSKIKCFEQTLNEKYWLMYPPPLV